MPSLRILLTLARASNLPTVWSNCLAAWWLGGGGSIWGLTLLLVGASLLYTGGMFLNDAVDVGFDLLHRRERPIPSGKISVTMVWRFSAGFIGIGALFVLLAGRMPGQFQTSQATHKSTPFVTSFTNSFVATPELRAATDDRSHPADQQTEPSSGAATNLKVRSLVISGFNARGLKHPAATALLTVALVACIVIYDLIHKAVTFSPVLMGACRTLLFLVAASTAAEGLTGLATWSALALGCYVAGLSFFARLERALRRPHWWPCALLVIPLALAYIANEGVYRKDALLLSVILGLWLLRSLRPTLGVSQQNIPRSVTALIAGIALVDLLAVCGAPREFCLAFLILFGATLLFQRFVPAT